MATQALGRSRGGFSTKIHVSVDALGNPLRSLTGGQQHDIRRLMPVMLASTYWPTKGSQEFRQHILEEMPVIPPRSMTGICTGTSSGGLH